MTTSNVCVINVKPSVDSHPPFPGKGPQPVEVSIVSDKRVFFKFKGREGETDREVIFGVGDLERIIRLSQAL